MLGQADVIVAPRHELLPRLAVVVFPNSFHHSNADTVFKGWLGRFNRYGGCHECWRASNCGGWTWRAAIQCEKKNSRKKKQTSAISHLPLQKGRTTFLRCAPSGYSWAGVDSAGEQYKLETRKMLENAADSPASSARFVSPLLIFNSGLLNCNTSF